MSEFKEIAHSGGKITFTFLTDAEGHRLYQFGIETTSTGPMIVTGVYALAQGIPIARYMLGGIGYNPPPPPVDGCFPVLIQSDSEGMTVLDCSSGEVSFFCAKLRE